MRTLKSVSCLLLAIVLLMSVCAVGAEAASEEMDANAFRDNSNFIQAYRPIPNGLLIYCAAQGELPTASAFRVQLGDRDLPVVNVDTTRNEPVTYYCLVDVSGSVTSVQLLCARQMLHSLCDHLEPGDQMVVATVGNARRASAYLTDRRIIHQKIDEIISTDEDTNLYRAITDSLEELDSGREATDRKCLVVFSDGIDDAAAEAGRTRQEAERKIEETRIPFYCMLPPTDQKDAGKTLGSFSRLSSGGEAYYLAERILTEEQIGRAIAADMKGDLILTTDLTGYTPQSDEQLLTVSYTDRMGIFYGDSINVISSNLLPGEAGLDGSAGPGSAGSNVALDSSESEESSDKKELPKWLIPAIAGGGLALAVLIAVLVSNKRREEERERKQKLEEERRRMSVQQPWQGGQQPWQSRAAAQAEEGMAGSSRGETATIGQAEETDRLGRTIKRGGRPVRFTAVGNQSFSTEVLLQEGQKTTVGRNGKADIILNKDDAKLSGVHFGLLLEKNTLRIWDMNSTNGTSVNGVPLVGNSVQIRSGETVTAGSYQYRIQF